MVDKRIILPSTTDPSLRFNYGTGLKDKYSNRDYTNTFADQAAKKLGLDGVDDYPILNDIELQADIEKTIKNNPVAQVGLRYLMQQTGGDMSKVLQNYLSTDSQKDLNLDAKPKKGTLGYVLTTTGSPNSSIVGPKDFNTMYEDDPENILSGINPNIRLKLSELAEQDSTMRLLLKEYANNKTIKNRDKLVNKIKTFEGTPISQSAAINHELIHYGIRALYNEGLLDEKTRDYLIKQNTKKEHKVIGEMSTRGMADDPVFGSYLPEGVGNIVPSDDLKRLDLTAEQWLKDNSPPVQKPLHVAPEDQGNSFERNTTPYTGKLPGRLRNSVILEEKYDGAIPAGLAKGGDIMPMEQQMEMFGSDPMGGLDDDGMSRDPVSGNEIPPGSMANEVRDDVDAKLSDGEYVVPANVVRFFGVKFFEDLRSQAMQGLSAMEANGRIGGEPVPAEMPMQDQMAGAASELTEQDMAMLQGMMNEGGYVQGYNHGGLHDPVTDKAIPQSVPSSVYPVNQFITPGASTISSALNPYVAPSAGTPKPTTPAVGSDATVRYVTYVKPGSGEIRVIAFRGDTPVNPDEVTSALQAGYFPQGSDELAEYQRDANRNPEDDWNVQDGSKPPNKMTVGELAWSLTRTTYAAGNPDSFTAGFGNLVGKGLGTGVMKSVLGNVPSDAEIYIKTAQNRLKTNNYSNAKEKEILEGIANQSGVAMGLVNKNMVALTGINFKLGKEKGKDIPFNNRVPDYSTSRAQKKAAQLIEETKDMKGVSDDVKTALDDDGSDYGADYYYDYKKDPAYIASNKAKKNAEVKATATTEDNNNTVSTPSRSFDPNDSGMGAAVAEKEKASDKAAKSAGATRSRGGSREFGMNKGGLLKKPTKKKTKK